MGPMSHRKSQSALAELLRLKDADSLEASSGVIQNVLDALRSQLAMDVAFISEFHQGERVFRFVSCGDANAPIAVGGSNPLNESYCCHVVEGRLPELIRDAAKIPMAAAMPVTAELPVGAHLSVPLQLSDGSIYGTMCGFSSAPDESLNDRNLDILRIAAQLTADLIERQANREARQEELKARIDRVIATNGFIVVCQPIYRIADRKMVGAEALVRFEDSAQRPPIAWFDEADEIGMTVELEMAAIRLALAGLPSLPPTSISRSTYRPRP